MSGAQAEIFMSCGLFYFLAWSVWRIMEMAPGVCNVVAVGSWAAGSRHESHELSCSTVVRNTVMYLFYDFFSIVCCCFFSPWDFRILRDGSSEIL